MEQTITVVGAGPAGLIAAKSIAEQGFPVTVLEEHSVVGVPTHCTGLVSKTGAFLNRLPIKDALVNEVEGAKIFSPNGTMLRLCKYETVAHVLDRAKLDQNCLKEAEKAGVEIKTSAKMLNARNETIFLQHNNRGEMHKSRIIIGADGVNSKVRELMGVKVSKDKFVNSYQVIAKGKFDKHFVELHFGDYAKGLFAWIVPESRDTARIGLGCSLEMNAKQALDKFIQEKQLDVQVGEGSAFLIPIGEPLKQAAKSNMLLVGDSGFHTKATTGGGIVTGAMAAQIAGETISEHLKNKKPLQEYDKNLSHLNKELSMHWKIHKFLVSQSNQQMDKMFEKLKKAKVESLLEKYGNMDRPSLFVGRFMKNPRLWGLLGPIMKIAMS